MRLSVLATLLAAIMAVSAQSLNDPSDALDESAFKCIAGRQKCVGRKHYVTCGKFGHKWHKHQCPHGRVCYQGFGAAKHHVFCGNPRAEFGYTESEEEAVFDEEVI
jgi:hypothetical protein